MRTHTLALLLSRTHSLSPAGALGPACPCGFSCGLFLLEIVPLFLCPSLSLFAQLCPSLGLLLAFGGRGGIPLPLVGVVVLRLELLGLFVLCALVGRAWVFLVPFSVLPLSGK